MKYLKLSIWLFIVFFVLFSILCIPLMCVVPTLECLSYCYSVVIGLTISFVLIALFTEPW